MCEQALARGIARPVLLSIKGDALGALGREAEAKVAYEQVLTFPADNFVSWAARGSAHAGMGQLIEALAAYDEALTLDHDNHDEAYALRKKADVLRALGRDVEAQEAEQRADELDRSTGCGTLVPAVFVVCASPVPRRTSVANDHHYIPQPPLSAFVESFWLYEGERPAHAKERRLPDGSVGLVFNLHDDLIRTYDRRDQEAFRGYRGAVLSGPQSGYVVLDTASLVSTLGVTFRPGGMLPFLPFPVSDLSDQVLSLEALWGAEVADLRGSLRIATTPAARFAILERCLLSRLDLSRTSHPALARAVAGLRDAARFPTVASLAEHIGLSQTRLVQVFRDAMGMTPKQFARLSRFQRVLARLDAGGAADWADTVFACGYFDQSHLIHEFQAFAGLTPGQYLAMRGGFRNHVPLPA